MKKKQLTAEIQPSVGEYRAGSARILKGNIYTLSCFVSGPDESWTKEEKKQMLKKLRESLLWLEKQARRYNVSVNFDAKGVYWLEKDIKLPTIVRGTGSGNEPVDWVQKLLYKVGYSSTLDFIDWVTKNTNCTNTQVLIFVKGKGRSYAIPTTTKHNKERYFVEGAVLYQKYSTGREKPSAPIAHEILHLYGAWDLYETFRQSAENAQRAKKRYPNSIMLRSSVKNIDILEVDEISAWRVGWNTNPKDWYATFEPNKPFTRNKK